VANKREAIESSSFRQSYAIHNSMY